MANQNHESSGVLVPRSPINNSISIGASPSATQSQTHQNQTKYYALRKLGLRIHQSLGLTLEEIDGIESVAAEHLKTEESIEAALKAAKAATAYVRALKKSNAQAERTLHIESAVILESARSAAESTRGVPISTNDAIHQALKTARTSRQRLSLLLRLNALQKSAPERTGS